MKQSGHSVFRVFLFCGLVWPVVAAPQDNDSAMDEPRLIVTGPDAAQSTEPIRKLRPCFDAQSGESAKQQEAKALANLPANYRYWLTEDALYIIAPGERCAFMHLDSDKEWDDFIEQFWYRRASDPISLENDFKKEHYRRIVFANEKFGTDIPGWKIDRGHVYVLYGPPDKIESHPNSEPSWRPLEEETGSVKYSWGKWHYRYVESIGENVDLEFVDLAGTGDYCLRMRPQNKDTLLFNPAYNLGGVQSVGASPEAGQQVVLHIGPEPAALVKYKELEAVMVTHLIRDQVL